MELLPTLSFCLSLSLFLLVPRQYDEAGSDLVLGPGPRQYDEAGSDLALGPVPRQFDEAGSDLARLPVHGFGSTSWAVTTLSLSLFVMGYVRTLTHLASIFQQEGAQYGDQRIVSYYCEN